MRSSILGVICLICGVVLMTTGGNDRPREVAGLDGGRPVLAANGRHSAAVSPREPAYLGRAIRDVRVGQRVIAENPQIDDAERAAFGPEPDEVTWRRLTLRMTKGDGGRLDVTLLRPVAWLDAAGAWPGATVELDLPELGAQGPAEVLSVGPCPPIEPANPALGSRHRVVTGTFAHSSGDVLDVHVAGLDEPLGTTGNHPFWSEDRWSFVEAGALRVGERLRLVGRELTKVQGITRRGPPEAVYNLEVHGEHVYYVGRVGVLVHNTYDAPNSGVSWNNGWRTADGKFASPRGPGRAGGSAEVAVWDAVEAKPGWSVRRGRVSVRDASGELRVYDGAAISPKGRVIGLEVKSGTSPYRGSQRAFDTDLNASGADTIQALGDNSDLWIRRAKEIRK